MMAKLKQRWIPCSEKLPEDDGWYLTSFGNEWTTDHFGKINKEKKIYSSMVRIHKYDKKSKNFYTGYGLIVGMVAAWMPLPEPYGGEKE